MTTEATILSEIKKLKQIVTSLSQQSKKEDRWVSAYWVQDITGWDENKLQLARRQQLVKWRRKGKQGVEYLLSSVPEEFKKKIA